MSCPLHGPASAPEHLFCEVCGGDLGAAVAAPPPWLSSRAAAGPCPACGAQPGGPYCDHCGRRRPVGRDHAVLDLGGVAGCTDRGRRRPHNEDALAVGRLAGVLAAVVCDGVSTSSRADEAAHAAADAGIATLLATLETGGDGKAAILDGAAAATEAARATARPGDRTTPPSCTYVAAVATEDGCTIGWIGDSRAYWVGADGQSACLTVDDSAAGLVAAGRPVPGIDPASRALIRWLGADADGGPPQLVTLTPAGPGRLLLCSDGLSHYLGEPDRLAEAVAAAPGPPVALAAELTRLAVVAGGHDNIAVAVLDCPPDPRGGAG